MAADENDKKNSVDLVSYEKPIDVNRVRLKILIICSNEADFGAAVTYLTRRGWQAQVMSNVLDAFKQVTVFDPNFVLVSVNTKSPKVMTLPQVLYQTFKIPVILFGENTDTLTLKLLQDISANFKMPGLASGPSIHRSIKNILQELMKSFDLADREIYTKIVRSVKRNVAARSDNPYAWKKQKKGYTFSTEGTVHEDKSKAIARFYEKIAEEEREQRRKKSADFSADEGNSNAAEIDFNDDLAAIAAKFYQEIRGDEEIGNPSIDLDDLKLSDYEEAEGDEVLAYGEEEEEKSKSNPFSLFRAILGRKDPKTKVELDDSLDDVSFSLGNELAENLKHYLASIAEKASEEAGVAQFAGTQVATCMLWPLLIDDKMSLIVTRVYGTDAQSKVFSESFEENVKKYLRTHLPDAEIGDALELGEILDLKDHVKGEIFTIQTGGEAFSVQLKYVVARLETPLVQDSAAGDKSRIDASELVVGLPTGADIYLYFPVNDRYIRYTHGKLNLDHKQKDVLTGSEAYISNKDIKTYMRCFSRNRAIEKLFFQTKKKAS